MSNYRDTRDHIEIALERQIRILQWLADGGEALEELELLNHAAELRAALQIYTENPARAPNDAGHASVLARVMDVAHDEALPRDVRWRHLAEGLPADRLGSPCAACGGSGRTPAAEE